MLLTVRNANSNGQNRFRILHCTRIRHEWLPCAFLFKKSNRSRHPPRCLVLRALIQHASHPHTQHLSRRTPHTTYRSTESALDACTIARPSYYLPPRATRATSLRLSLSSSLCGSALSVTALPLCSRTAHARGASTTAAPKVSHATFAARCELPHRFTQRSNSGRRARGTARRRGPRVCVWDARPFGPAVAAFTTALLVAGRWDGGSARAGKGGIAGGRANTCQTT